MPDDSALFTLTEAAERTGLTVDALRKRIRRGKLDTVKGNDGLVRVRLSAEDMTSHGLAEGQAEASRPDERDRTIKALEGEAAALRDALGRERERADRAEAAAAAERARAGQAEAEREAARVAAAAVEGETRALRDRVQAAEARAGQAEAARAAARAELTDWTSGGPLARAWRALIYRR